MRISATSLLVIILALLISIPTLADWPMSGHDPARTFATDSPGPAESEILWSHTPVLPANLYADYRDLVVADGRIYWSGCETDYWHTQNGTLRCLDAATGEFLWMIDINSLIINPTIHDGRLFLCSAYIDAYYGTTDGGTVACRDAATGEPVWSKHINTASPSSCMVSGDVVLATGYYQDTVYDDHLSRLIALDADNGDILWLHSQAEYQRRFIPPAVSNGRIYSGWGDASQGTLLCFDLLTGGLLWQHPHHPTASKPPMVCDDIVVYRADSMLCAFNTVTGDQVWTRPDLNTNEMAFADGSIFITRNSGGLFRLDKDTGNTQWTFSTSSIKAPTVAGEYLYLTGHPGGGGEIIDCIDIATGVSVWSGPNGDILRSRSIANGNLYGTDWFTLYCVGDAPQPLSANLSCSPQSGTLPFASQFEVGMTNSYPEFHRRLQYEIAITLANQQHYPNWRRGWQNVAPGATFNRSWWQVIPAYVPLLGINTFEVTVNDVTPAPYNQPPYPPAGDTAVDSCTIVASEAP